VLSQFLLMQLSVKNVNAMKIFKIYCITMVIVLCAGGYLACAAALDAVKAPFLSGDYKTAIKEGEDIMATPDQPENARELYYMLGLSYLKDGNYLRSSDIFEILLKEYPGEPYHKEALLGLGDAYFLNGENEKARVWYEALLAYDPQSKLALIAKERLGRISVDEGNTAQAKEFLKDLPVNLVDSDLGTQTVGVYSVQVGSFSREANAKRLMNKLISQKYDAFLTSNESEKEKTYRVKVGHCQERNQAEEIRKKLTEDGYPTRIVP